MQLFASKAAANFRAMRGGCVGVFLDQALQEVAAYKAISCRS